VAAAADSAAKVEEVTAQVEALKATPIDAPIVPAAGAAAVVPGTATATARPVSERAKQMASTNDRMDRKFGFNKAN
jgi:hypothetical protein